MRLALGCVRCKKSLAIIAAAASAGVIGCAASVFAVPSFVSVAPLVRMFLTGPRRSRAGSSGSAGASSGSHHRRGESHVVRQLLCGDVHPVPVGPREADGNVEHRGGLGERGAQPAVGRPVRGGGRGRCAFGHRGDRPVHRALVRLRPRV